MRQAVLAGIPDIDRSPPVASWCGHSERVVQRHRRRGPRSLCRTRESGRVPRESLDAPEDLPNQALRQAALGQLGGTLRQLLPPESPRGKARGKP